MVRNLIKKRHFLKWSSLGLLLLIGGSCGALVLVFYSRSPELEMAKLIPESSLFFSKISLDSEAHSDLWQNIKNKNKALERREQNFRSLATLKILEAEIKVDPEELLKKNAAYFILSQGEDGFIYEIKDRNIREVFKNHRDQAPETFFKDKYLIIARAGTIIKIKEAIKNKKTLSRKEDFKNLVRRLPKEGLTFFYFKNDFLKNWFPLEESLVSGGIVFVPERDGLRMIGLGIKENIKRAGSKNNFTFLSKFAPADTLFLWNGSHFLSQYESINKIPYLRQLFEIKKRKLKEQTGIDLEEDLIESLMGEFTFLLTTDNALSLNWIYQISSSEEKKIIENAIFQYVQSLSLEEKEVVLPDGTKAKELVKSPKIIHPQDRFWGEVRLTIYGLPRNQGQIIYAYYKDYFILSTSEESLKRIILKIRERGLGDEESEVPTWFFARPQNLIVQVDLEKIAYSKKILGAGLIDYLEEIESFKSLTISSFDDKVGVGFEVYLKNK